MGFPEVMALSSTAEMYWRHGVVAGEQDGASGESCFHGVERRLGFSFD
jgi:hypothetical protein